MSYFHSHIPFLLIVFPVLQSYSGHGTRQRAVTSQPVRRVLQEASTGQGRELPLAGREVGSRPALHPGSSVNCSKTAVKN